VRNNFKKNEYESLKRHAIKILKSYGHPNSHVWMQELGYDSIRLATTIISRNELPTEG
jgi:hypothetical protein